MNRMEVPGRRAAEHPQGVCRRRKRQSPGERAAEGCGPYGGLSIEGQSRKKADIHPLPPDERQRKEELVHSSRNKPPLNPIARGKSFWLRHSFSRAPVSSPVTSFSLLDRARPVCLRPKSRRFAAVGLRHAPAGAVSFSSGRKNRGPRAACRVGRGGRNGAERSPRRQAGTEWAEFLPTTWGVHCTSHRWYPFPPARKGKQKARLTSQAKTHIITTISPR